MVTLTGRWPVDSWARSMFPTHDQIGQAAFDRWLRRGRLHGFDREDWFAAVDELSFNLNYHTIVEYPLDAPGMLILCDRPVRYCRFCERTATQVAFGPPMPLFSGRHETSLFTAAICNECQSAFCETQAADFGRFQDALAADGRRDEPDERPRASELYSLSVFKSLVAGALSIMPETELRYFVDALEWVSNPDPESDGLLLREGATCLVYSAPFLDDRSWTSLARRIDRDVPLPYMIYFLAQGGVVLQVQVPLCIRDQDLDGRPVRFIRRSFMASEGHQFDQVRPWELRLTSSGSVARGRARR
jgi:Protein of unknown function (DUF2934)